MSKLLPPKPFEPNTSLRSSLLERTTSVHDGTAVPPKCGNGLQDCGHPSLNRKQTWRPIFLNLGTACKYLMTLKPVPKHKSGVLTATFDYFQSHCLGSMLMASLLILRGGIGSMYWQYSSRLARISLRFRSARLRGHDQFRPETGSAAGLVTLFLIRIHKRRPRSRYFPLRQHCAALPSRHRTVLKHHPTMDDEY